MDEDCNQRIALWPLCSEANKYVDMLTKLSVFMQFTSKMLMQFPKTDVCQHISKAPGFKLLSIEQDQARIFMTLINGFSTCSPDQQ